MAHGSPDWWGGGASETVHSVMDVGELAARLYSPSVYERAGNVLFQDDFRFGLGRWLPSFAAGKRGMRIICTPIASGYYAMLLWVSDATSPIQHAYTYFADPVPSRCGFEVWISLQTAVKYVYLSMYHGNGTQRREYEVQYVHATGTLGYLSNVGGYVPFGAPGVLSASGYTYLATKLVVDIETGQYVRMHWGSYMYNLTGIPAYSAAYSGYPLLSLHIGVEATGGAWTAIAIDNVVVTQNEW